MSKLLLLTVFLTLVPGFEMWVVVASLMPGILLLVEDVAAWLDRPRRHYALPVRVERRGEPRRRR